MECPSPIAEDWAIYARSIILHFTQEKGSPIYKGKTFKFESELKTQKYFYGSESLRLGLSKWIDGLKFSDGVTNSKQSKAEREMGNALYKANKKVHAWKIYELYTVAIFRSPPGSVELPLAHANRATCLMVLQLFREAYDDCECALLNGYEEKNVPKLLIRQMSCASALKNKMLMGEAIAKMEKYESRLNKDFEAQYIGFMKEFDNLEELTEQAEVEEFKEKSQKICSSVKKGRYVLANEDIAAHETVQCEKAFSFVPHPPEDEKQIHSQCANCALELIIPIPCHECKLVSFCSLNCQRDNEKFHKFECKGLRKKLLQNIGIGYLGMRTFMTGFQDSLIALGNEEFTSPEAIWDRIFEFTKMKNSRYYDVLRLVSNLDKMKTNELFSNVFLSSMLVVYLKKNDFFKQIAAKSSIPYWETVAAALLMRHLAQTASNSLKILSIMPTHSSRMFLLNNGRVRLGKLHILSGVSDTFEATYARISLYNHSCEPNVRRRFSKTNCSMLADRRIAKGEEIFECYGPRSITNPKKERQEMLQEQYYFRCDCTACSGSDEDQSKLEQVICQSCHSVFSLSVEISPLLMLCLPKIVLCPKCKAPFSFDWFTNLFRICTLGTVINQLPKILKSLAKIDECTSGPNDAKNLLIGSFLEKFMTEFDENPSVKLSPPTWNSVIKIAENWLEANEGIMSFINLHYVKVLSIYLDLAMIKGRKLKNMDMIQRYVDFLPDRIRDLYAGYIEDYKKP